MVLSNVRATGGSDRCPRRAAASLITLAAVLTVGACQGDPDAAEAVPTPTTPAPAPIGPTAPPRDWSPRPTLEGPDGSVIDVVEVDDTAPKPAQLVEVVRALDYRLGEDAGVTVHDLMADGTAVISLFHDDDVDFDMLELLAPARMALWSDSGLTDLASSAPLLPGEPFREASAAVAVDDSVVWLETSVHGIGEPSWRLFRAGSDVSNGAALLARSEDADASSGGDVVAPFPLSLTVAGDRAAWALEGVRADGTVTSTVLSVPLDGGGTVRTEAPDATLAAATGAGVAVVRLADTGEPLGLEILEPAGRARPLVRFPEPAADAGRFVPTLVADGDLVAWVMDGGIYVTSLAGGPVHRAGRDASPDSVAVCDGRVTWAPAVQEGYPEIAYVFAPATGEVSLLDLGQHTGSITCGGPFLSWTEVREGDGGGEVRTAVVARWAD